MGFLKSVELKTGAHLRESDYISCMLTPKVIEETALRVASKHLPKGAIESVSSVDAIDSDGFDAVRITITLKRDAAKKIRGDEVLDALVGIQNALASAGEGRTPIIEYSETGEAVAADGDS